MTKGDRRDAGARVRPHDVLLRICAAAICAIDIQLGDGTMFCITSGTAQLPLISDRE
jgi:hypothetical protein